MITQGDTGLIPVFFIGKSDATEVRRRAADDSRTGARHVVETVAGRTDLAPGSACFVALPISEAVSEARRLVRMGCHVFLDAARVPSVHDLQEVSRIAEEAGVSVGVSRPLRFADGAEAWSDRATIVVIEAECGGAAESWQRGLSDTLDLCIYLCRSFSTRNVEVSTERPDRIWPVFAAASLRFDNGSLAVLSLRRSATPREMRCVAAAGTEVHQLRLARTTEAYAAETAAFLREVAHERPVPVSLSDALAGARLLDQILALMR